jgi:molecular chaperone Hsp33
MRHPDRLVRGLLPRSGLRVAFVRVGDTARMARVLHGLYPTSAHVFAQSLAAGTLLASLQKEKGRVNLQLQCDGPLAGLLVDADPEGNVRGWVRRPEVHFPGDPERAARAALGGSGFVSVLRQQPDGQFYRSAIELAALDVVEDLRAWFARSEQVGTALDVRVVADGTEPLGDVAGLLVQRLPDGDDAALDAVRDRLAGGALGDALRAGGSAQEVVDRVLGPGLELLADFEVAYRCTCSADRARAAVGALGAEGVRDILAKEREAVITCEFCRERYVVGEGELRDLLRRLEAQEQAS